MPRIFYLPYAKYTIESDLPMEQVMSNLQATIIKPKFLNTMSLRRTQKFVGNIDSKSGRFIIVKQINHRNSFNPTIRGIISKTNSGSKISVVIRLPTFGYIFVILFCLVWLIVSVIQVQTLEDLLLPVGGIAFVYVLSFFGFNMAAGQALDRLYELV